MKLIAPEDLKLKKGINLSAVQRTRLIKAGKFPQPIRFNGGTRGRTAFIEEEIDAFIEQRMTERKRKQRAA